MENKKNIKPEAEELELSEFPFASEFAETKMKDTSQAFSEAPDDVAHLAKIYDIEDFEYANFRKKETLAEKLNKLPFFHQMYLQVEQERKK